MDTEKSLRERLLGVDRNTNFEVLKYPQKLLSNCDDVDTTNDNTFTKIQTNYHENPNPVIEILDDINSNNMNQGPSSEYDSRDYRFLHIHDNMMNFNISPDSIPNNNGFRNTNVAISKEILQTQTEFDTQLLTEIYSPLVAVKNSKKKLTSEEIPEKKLKSEAKKELERQKLERKKEREAKKLEKEKAAQIRKAWQLSRMAFQPKECLKHMSVILDPGVINQPGLGAVIFSACDDIGVTYQTESQRLPYIVSWRRSTVQCDTEAQEVKTWTVDVEENEIVIFLPLDQFTEMVYNFKQKQTGNLDSKGMPTIEDYAANVQSTFPGCSVTLAVIGMESYYQKHKKSCKKQRNNGNVDMTVSRIDVEEAFLNIELKKSWNCQLVQSVEEAANIVRTFTKSIAEKPMKKDRLQSEFSFHNEKVNNNSGSTDMQSLWKLQLQQFRNISSDVANAIVSQYPSPKCLYQTYEKCSTETEGTKILQDIMVRRNAGVLQSSRRVGKEAARRIYQLMTSEDPDLMLK